MSLANTANVIEGYMTGENARVKTRGCGEVDCKTKESRKRK